MAQPHELFLESQGTGQRGEVSSPNVVIFVVTRLLETKPCRSAGPECTRRRHRPGAGSPRSSDQPHGRSPVTASCVDAFGKIVIPQYSLTAAWSPSPARHRSFSGPSESAPGAFRTLDSGNQRNENQARERLQVPDGKLFMSLLPFGICLDLNQTKWPGGENQMAITLCLCYQMVFV